MSHKPSRFILTLAAGLTASLLLFWALASASNSAALYAQAPGTPTPEQSADECVSAVSGNGTINGNWSSDCASEGRSGSYASYYTFTLAESADVTITAESSVDTYLFLREGSGRDGAELCSNDDYGPDDSSNRCQGIESALRSVFDSGLVASLGAGAYTIEVTTYTAGETGAFTLTISGLPDAAPPTPTPTPEPTPEPAPPTDECVSAVSLYETIDGSWSSDCASEGRSGSYASYYTFTLAESAEVSITAESGVDTYLFLRQGSGRDGTEVAENDDHAAESDCVAELERSTDSCIVESLDVGSYTIEVTTYTAGETGEFTLTIGALSATVTPTPTPTHSPIPEPTITITFGDLNWPSAMLQNRIAQYIAEMGYGYSTSVPSGSTLPLFQALRAGDIDVLMEVWLPNLEEDWEEALTEGSVSSPGRSLGTDWLSAFVIPKYLQEQYPDLDSVEDLKEEQYRSLFATDETDGKARLMSCVIGWSCEVVNAKQVEGYGLSDHVHIVYPASGADLNADLTEAYENEEPWLGYQWGTSDAALLLDLVRLEEPAYSDECWSTTMACAYEDATILIAVNAGLSESAGDFVDMLTEWDFNVDEVYKPVARWQADNPDANTEDAALWWLRGNNEIWSNWVTTDASAAIQSALDSGEIPEGWPQEPNITPDPAPMPEPPADECVSVVSADGAISGNWSRDCPSEGRSGSYASYYTFTLVESADVTITVESTVDTFLFLRQGSGSDGAELCSNDDYGSSVSGNRCQNIDSTLRRGYDSGLVASLGAGSYTIEVTTFSAGQTGAFTLTVEGLPATTPPPTDECVSAVSGNGTITGNWSSDCASEGRSGSYASYYTFTLAESADVTITAESSVDTFLFLRQSGRDGTEVAENDDHAAESDCAAGLERATDSCIVESLDAGSYTVEVTTYTAGETGAFRLTVGGLPVVVLGPSTDRAALVALYNATGGPNWVFSDNWLSDRPLGEWYGVTTDANGRVTELSLYTIDGNKRIGERGSTRTTNGLSGSIPSELGNLPNLRRLDLGSNNLSGSIPPELGSLANLGMLDLGGNNLSGPIPSELGSLSNLTRMALGRNQLTGSIPRELGSLTNLEAGLLLSSNNLSGPIPSELGNLANLEALYLRNNDLTGAIPPELGRLSNLEALELSSNNLSGPIPPELGSLSNLRVLALHTNQLSGALPGSLTNLSLGWFRFGANAGLCAPTDAAFQTWLQSIDNHSGPNCAAAQSDDRAALVALYNATDGPNWRNNTNWLSNRPIGEWHGVSTNETGRVTELNLEGNNLSGQIPSELGGLSNLEHLWLRSNHLTGTIPSELGSLSNLRELDFRSNRLTGRIPVELGSLSNLERLGLEFNQLSGEIPLELGNLANLEDLWLHDNQLSGEIPSELGDLANLEDLWLSSNQLTGTIPSELGSLSNLRGLNLSNNQLTGRIPVELGSLSNLVGLSLQSNQLTGRVPVELGSLSNLVRLRLHNNQLTGALPGSMTNLSLDAFHFGDNDGLCAPTDTAFQSWLQSIDSHSGPDCSEQSSDRAALVALYNATGGPNWTNNTNWLSNRPIGEWHGVSTNSSGKVTALRLDSNNLSGPIPRALGSLSNLTSLALRDNSLSGSIPRELGSLSNLDSLWLYENNLSGSIPNELGKLSNLTHLDLNSNSLSGPIPSELGNLSSLSALVVHTNQLSGALPSSLTNLALTVFFFQSNAGLCAPTDADFQRWLQGLRLHNGPNCPDRAALVALYNATGGPNWTNNTNWLSDRPLNEWYGVTTGANGRVIRLNLYSNNLRGSIPSELGNLSNLRILFLAVNSLSGSIPSELGGLSNLTHLDIAVNSLSGSIPIELGNLSSLTHLNLNGNQLTGAILPQLGNLYNLEALYLNGNQLTGAIPPQLGSLSNLTGLYLHGNQLSGSVPSELGNLSSLRRLYLNFNDLSGALPDSLTNLSLSLFYFGDNAGLCAPTDSAFQTWLQGISDRSGPNCDAAQSDDRTALVALYNATDGPNWTNNTNWLSDRPIGEWHGVTTNDSGRVTALSLDSNNLSGSIPSNLGNLSNLRTLDLRSNNLSGSIPRELGNLPNLEYLALNSNRLSGSIPRELGSLSNLASLVLSFNQLSGSIPSELGNLSNLRGLWLDNNNLSGSILRELGSLSNLASLALSFNQLSGSIPSELGNLSSLRRLYLASNQLSGALPGSLTNLSLSLFNFSDNNAGLCAPTDTAFQTWLQGIAFRSGPNCAAAPASPDRAALVALYNATGGSNWTNNTNWLSNRPLGEWHGVTTNSSGRITTLNLRDNSLSGSIPSALDSLSNLTLLNLTNNNLSGSIPRQLGNLSKLEVLILHGNNLSGSIPSQLGNLSNLRTLNLTRNQLSGSVPSELGNLANLTGLWLTSNRLSGALPRSLTNLSSLASFFFSSNSGLCAPTDTAFQTWLQGISNRSGPNCAAPDLVVNAPTVSDSSPTVGTSITLRATVRNQGGAQSAGTILRYYRSADSTITASDTSVGTDSVGSLAASGTSAESISLTAPTSPGTYYFGACVDAVAGESNTANNCSAAVRVTVRAVSTDRAALVALYNATGGSNWTNNTNWLSNRPIGEWHGVTTDASGRVTTLNLRDNSLSGSIPSALGSLSNLTLLNLTNNNLSGSIPSQLGNLSKLEYLILHGNNLSGSIPSQLGNLSNLRALNLTSNQLSGSVPSGLGNLANLTGLWLTSNRLSGALPGSLTNLSSLGSFFFSSNSGLCAPTDTAFQTWLQSISARSGPNCPAPDLVVNAPTVSDSSPTVGTSITLRATVRNQGGAQSAGTILRYYRSADSTITASDASVGTDSVGSLAASGTSAESISLTAPTSPGTYYYGACVDAVAGESNTANNCSAAVRVTVRAVSTDRAALVALYNATGGSNWTNNTNWLSDRPIGEWHGVTTNDSGRVTRVFLNSNNLSGSIPRELANLSNLTRLILTVNNLSGSIPSELGNLPNLTHLWLDQNNLSGSIPSELGSLSNLEVLYLDRNNLSGSIPSQLGNLSKLVGLQLNSNQLTGALPGSLTNLSLVRWFYFQSNAGLCAPTDTAFQTWLQGISLRSGPNCPSPDLVVNATVSDSSPTVGTSITLSATVRNQGGAQSAATTLRYYSSADSTITTSDSFISSRSVGSLAAGGSRASSLGIGTSPPGTYYLGACVDAVAGESNTANNCSAAVRVTVVP